MPSSCCFLLCPSTFTRSASRLNKRADQHLCQTIGLDVSGWFSAVLIFDILRSKGELDYESIPETCVALVAMLKRNDTTETAVNVASLAQEERVRWDLKGIGISKDSNNGGSTEPKEELGETSFPWFCTCFLSPVHRSSYPCGLRLF